MKKLSKINEDLFHNSIKREYTGDVKKENDLDDKEIKSIKMHSTTFADYVFFYEAYQNIQVDFERYCRDLYRKFVPCNVDDVISHVKRNWNKGVDYESYINDHIKKNEEMLKKHGFKKQPDETIKDTLDDFWSGLGYGDKYEILNDLGYEIHRLGWDDDDGTYDDYWDNMDWEEKVEIYMDYNNMNEDLFHSSVKREYTYDPKKEDVFHGKTNIDEMEEINMNGQIWSSDILEIHFQGEYGPRISHSYNSINELPKYILKGWRLPTVEDFYKLHSNGDTRYDSLDDILIYEGEGKFGHHLTFESDFVYMIKEDSDGNNVVSVEYDEVIPAWANPNKNFCRLTQTSGDKQILVMLIKK